jgi:hypothetical protein
MNAKSILATACALALLAGCASRAGGVAPMSISAAEYSHLTCADARAALEVSRQRENALTRQQNNAATADAVGVFLLFVPAGSLFGGNVEGELSQAKGEVLALERVVPQRCAAEAQAAAAAAATAAAPTPVPAPNQ